MAAYPPVFQVICHLHMDAFYVYRLGGFLLGREQLVRRPLRLLGLGASNLREPTAQQLTLP